MASSSPADLELLALVREIHAQKKTGLLELETEESEKHLYFVAGELHLLASAPSAHSIARLLRMKVWGDAVSQEALHRLYPKIAGRLLSWRTDSFRFVEGRKPPLEELVGPLPTAQILMAAVSEGQALEHLRRWLSADQIRIVASQSEEPIEASVTGPAEIALLSHLKEPLDLPSLLARAGTGDSRTFARIARLWAVDLLRAVSDASLQGGPRLRQPSLGSDHSAEFNEIDEIWKTHFGLTGDPFSLTPDPAFLFTSEGHGEALAGLKLGLLERRGLIAMTGEVGTGKTTLLYSLLSGLDSEVEAAYICNTTLSCEEILKSALLDFGVRHPGSSRLEVLGSLNGFLTRLAACNRTAALVIDEAQNLSDETFEQLRLLLNFETFDRKLLQIVLVGQPELASRLQAPQLRQIADRIAVRCHLEPLSRQEARAYIRHRLESAGASSDIFSNRSLRLLARETQGIPRRINIACHNAMLFAYAAQERNVGRNLVTEALRGLGSSTNLDRSRGAGVLPGLIRERVKFKAIWAGAIGLPMLIWLGLTMAGDQAERRGPSEDARIGSGAPVASLDTKAEGIEESRGRRAVPARGAGWGAQFPSGAVALPFPQLTSAEPRVARTTNSLRLRSGPSLEALVLEVLPLGSRVDLLEEQGDWRRVVALASGHSGWVSGLYLEESDQARQNQDPDSGADPG